MVFPRPLFFWLCPFRPAMPRLCRISKGCELSDSNSAKQCTQARSKGPLENDHDGIFRITRQTVQYWESECSVVLDFVLKSRMVDLIGPQRLISHVLAKAKRGELRKFGIWRENRVTRGFLCRERWGNGGKASKVLAKQNRMPFRCSGPASNASRRRVLEVIHAATEGRGRKYSPHPFIVIFAGFQWTAQEEADYAPDARPTPSMRRDRRLAAVHQAGHLVVARQISTPLRIQRGKSSRPALTEFFEKLWIGNFRCDGQMLIGKRSPRLGPALPSVMRAVAVAGVVAENSVGGGCLPTMSPTMTDREDPDVMSAKDWSLARHQPGQPSRKWQVISPLAIFSTKLQFGIDCPFRCDRFS